MRFKREESEQSKIIAFIVDNFRVGDKITSRLLTETIGGEIQNCANALKYLKALDYVEVVEKVGHHYIYKIKLLPIEWKGKTRSPDQRTEKFVGLAQPRAAAGNAEPRERRVVPIDERRSLRMRLADLKEELLGVAAAIEELENDLKGE